MKKLLLMAVAALGTLSASAQHVEWNANMLPQTYDEGIAAGYWDYWSSYYVVPGGYELFNEQGVSAVIENNFLVSPGNSKYSGKETYAMKPIMGMTNSTRSGVTSYAFISGIEESGYLRTSSYSNGDAAYTFTDAIVTLTVNSTSDEVAAGTYGMVTLTYNRGGNNSAMYVVDATANSGEGMQVLQTVTRCDDDNIQDHVARFFVEPGHTYYIMASEKGSVELYSIAYDSNLSDQYEVFMTADNTDVYWNANMLPQTYDEGIAAGYWDYWSSYYVVPGGYELFNEQGVSAVIENNFLVSPGNSKYSGKETYAMKPIMGMTNSTRSGVTSYAFISGIEESGYLRTSSYSNGDAAYTFTDAIVTLTVNSTSDEVAAGTYGMVTLTYNRGGNNSAMYVVDATANSGEGMQVLQTVTRCDDDNIQDHVARFFVEPGHTYYIMASEKGSVELYALGYAPNTSENYKLAYTAAAEEEEETDGIAATVATTTVANNMVYSLDGRCLGTSLEGLAKGLYIQNGKKFIVK